MEKKNKTPTSDWILYIHVLPLACTGWQELRLILKEFCKLVDIELIAWVIITGAFTIQKLADPINKGFILGSHFTNTPLAKPPRYICVFVWSEYIYCYSKWYSALTKPKRCEIGLVVGWKLAWVRHQGNGYQRLEKLLLIMCKTFGKTTICDNLENRPSALAASTPWGNGWNTE